jgi:hypothetical protein
MTLESRASRAVRSLKSSVAKAALPAGIGSIIHRRRFDRIGAFAFTLLIVALIGGAVYALPGVVGGDDAASDTSVTTTLGDTTSSMPGSTPVFVGGGPGSSGDGGAFEPAGYCPPWADCESGPGDATSTTEPQDGAFTAHQQYSSSDANPPKSYYYGTGEPGTTIWVGSWDNDYGSATTTVNENGEWGVWVEFPDAPACSSFKVKVHDVPWTVSQVFTFRVWGEGCVSYEFTAHQKWEVIDGNPPTNFYWGTGIPGTTVWVGSWPEGHYGSNTTTVNENGEWEIWVEFSDAPCSEWFSVKAHDEDWTGYQFFELKVVGDGCSGYCFTAHQETVPHVNPPVGEYWGTGQPGDTIWVGHYPNGTFGSTEVTVEPDGTWDARIEYDVSGAYCNAGFTVKAINGSGQKIAFTFTPTQGSGCTVFTANPVEYASTNACVYYSGTGIPGDTIWVGSYPEGTYGSNTTTVAGNGTWGLEVCFNGAPVGERFLVKAHNEPWTVYKALYFTLLEPEPTTTTTSTTTSTTTTTAPE